MKKTTFTSGLIGILLSTNTNAGEIVPGHREMKCGKWENNTQLCQHYYNGRKTNGLTKKHRNERFKIDLVAYAWDGKTFDEAVQIAYDDLGRVFQMWHLIAGEVDRHYYCFFEDNGVKKSEYIDDGQSKRLYEAHDLDEDGRLDRTIYYRYDDQGKMTEQNLDEDGDGKIDAVWDFEKEEWIPKPAKKVYKAPSHVW